MKQKLLKLIICLIVLVLSCLKNYAQVITSTGELIQSDSTLVTIPISYIKLANKKLIERQLLIETNLYKDSIILDYKKYINEQSKITKDFQKRIDESNRINQDLSKRLNRQQKTSLVLGSIAGASVVIIVLTALIN